MSDLIITSPANPRLKSLVALRRRRAREEAGTTLIEGYDELSLALDAGVVPRTVYFCPELMLHPDVQGDVVTRVAARSASETQQLGRAAFEKVAYREGPDGFLAVVDAVTRTCAGLTVGHAPLVLLCQGVEKPGNLGAMLRTADAAGAEAVIAADPVTDWGNPNLVRASKGTVFSVPVASDSTEATLQWLRDHDITLVATTPDTDLDYTDVDYTGPVAVAVGAEKYGLTDEVLAAAQHKVRIPMAGRANSLNVATSAAIVIYEAVRQRGRLLGPPAAPGANVLRARSRTPVQERLPPWHDVRHASGPRLICSRERRADRRPPSAWPSRSAWTPSMVGSTRGSAPATSSSRWRTSATSRSSRSWTTRRRTRRRSGRPSAPARRAAAAGWAGRSPWTTCPRPSSAWAARPSWAAGTVPTA